MRLRNVWMSAAAAALAATVVACGGSKETSSTSAEPNAPGGTPAGQKVDTATAGDVKGAVALDGTAPKNEAIKMNADPVCMRENKSPQFQETYTVGSDGKSLANVFVYVKDGLGIYVYDTPTEPATIDQKECRYHPHVFGMRVGQPMQGMKTTHTFTAKEVMVPFKCDVHGWMNAYVGVLDHPYYAVTDKDGKFELKDVPPGTYTIEAWHEKSGAQTVSVTLGQKETKDISFTFKPTATATN